MHEGKIAQKNKWRHNKVLLIWGIVRRPMKKEKIGYGLFVGKKMKNYVRKLSNDSK